WRGETTLISGGVMNMAESIPGISTITPLAHPAIQATLVIDGISGQYANFHLELENLGDSTAENIRVNMHGQGFEDLEVRPFMHRNLPPKGKLSIMGPPVALLADRYESLDIELLFTTEHRGIVHN